MKKIFTIIFMMASCFILITSSVGSSLAEEMKDEESEDYFTVVFYRYDIDGSVIPISVDIDIGDGENLEDKISSKCDELFKNDIEIQGQLDNLTKNYTIGAGFLLVRSVGKGFHYESKTRKKLLKRPKILKKIIDKINILKIKLPDLNLLGRKKHVFCKYAYDLEANTTITPIVRSSINESYVKTVEGQHSVYVYNFVGYTSWLGRFSFSPLDVLPRAFTGYGNLIICNDLG